MFGYVTASRKELTAEMDRRYGAVYCGICRRIRIQSGNVARLGLSYDMAFLALLLMSLYEPEEETGGKACALHPVRKRPWVDNQFIQYAADMNVALSYYNFLDDWEDDGKRNAKFLADRFSRHLPEIAARYPRQCTAMEDCIRQLNQLEKAGCDNPDIPASCFGQLMGELFTYEEDLWASTLRQMGLYLGRFIYLLDAALDYDKDAKKGKYNPYLAMGTGKNWEKWDEYLILTMARCTDYFEKLPLVQDKPLLDNILYSGVWANNRRKGQKEHHDDRGSL